METTLNITRISREDLKKKIDEKENFILVDVLDKEYFDKEHIPGAINIPVHSKDFEKKAKKILTDKNARIIVYCASFTCSASPRAAEKLMKIGYKNVLDFKGGIADWKEGRYEIVR